MPKLRKYTITWPVDNIGMVQLYRLKKKKFLHAWLVWYMAYNSLSKYFFKSLWGKGMDKNRTIKFKPMCVGQAGMLK